MLTDNNSAHIGKTRVRCWKRWATLVCLCAMLPAMGGCYGRFPLTRALHKFNGEITEHKIVHNIFFWIFIWLPVYWIAQLGDAVIFNLIEFWTGSEFNLSSTTQHDGKTITLMSSSDGNALTLTVSKDGEKLGESHFIRVEEGRYEVRNAADELEGMIINTPDGNLSFRDADGRELQSVDVQDLVSQAEFQMPVLGGGN